MSLQTLIFRFRYALHFVIYLIGFLAPWNLWRLFDSKPNTWGWLDSLIFEHASISFASISILLLSLGIVFALAGALLRTWGSAYIGAGIVQDQAMHGHRIVAAGPYRYMRNPLYLGTFLHTLAITLLMPPTGALFTVVAIAALQIWLILSEEPFLARQLGEPYLEYKAQVPRLFPALTPRTPPSQAHAAWPLAFVSEIYFWGVFISFAVLGWRYNAQLVTKGLLISLGVSLIVRALLPRGHAAEPTVA